MPLARSIEPTISKGSNELVPVGKEPHLGLTLPLLDLLATRKHTHKRDLGEMDSI